LIRGPQHTQAIDLHGGGIRSGRSGCAVRRPLAAQIQCQQYPERHCQQSLDAA